MQTGDEDDPVSEFEEGEEGRQERRRKRIKRVPIADLEDKSFRANRSIQGKVILCEPVEGEEQQRKFCLKDIVVAGADSINAAGLNARESSERFEAQMRKRGENIVAVHTIHVTLRGEFGLIPVKDNDIVLIRGTDVQVLGNTEKNDNADHVFKILVEAGNCEVEIIPTIQPKRKTKTTQINYSNVATTYFLENGEALSTRSRTINRGIDDGRYTRFRDLELKPIVDVYGLVVNVAFPSKTRSKNYRLAIQLVDETTSLDSPVEFCAFVSPQDLLEYLPFVQCLGSIVRLHRVRVDRFGSQLQLLKERNSTMTIVSTEFGDFTDTQVKFKDISKTEVNWARVDQLRSLAKNIISSQNEQNPLPFIHNQYLKTLTVAMHETGDDSSMMDLLVRVVTLPQLEPDEAGIYSFKVTDGRTEALVVLFSGEPGMDSAPHYWPLVVRYVGNEVGQWIKIKNCQVVRNDKVILAHSGIGTIKATSFLRVPNVLCADTPLDTPLPHSGGLQSSTNFVVDNGLSRHIISEVHATAQHMPYSSLADVIKRVGEAPYRVMVRVVNLYPENEDEFCKARADGHYTWAVALQLEDTTGRVDAVLTADDATTFFRLPPVNLKTNEASLIILQLSVAAMVSDNCWLDCLLNPLVDGSKVFAVVDTVLKNVVT